MKETPRIEVSPWQIKIQPVRMGFGQYNDGDLTSNADVSKLRQEKNMMIFRETKTCWFSRDILSRSGIDVPREYGHVTNIGKATKN